jgi:hypothetical protein
VSASHVSSIIGTIANVTREPLIPLARAVAAEAQRLDIEDLTYTIDHGAGTVTVAGERLQSWGPRTVLESSLGKCGLAFNTFMPSGRIVIYATGINPIVTQGSDG